MRLIQSPDDPVLSWEYYHPVKWGYTIPDSRFNGVAECPNLEIRIGQTVGDAVLACGCTCEWCSIIREDIAKPDDPGRDVCPNAIPTTGDVPILEFVCLSTCMCEFCRSVRNDAIQLAKNGSY
jgi:hypothetical protein